MLPQIKVFVMNHWAMVAAFVVVVVMLVIEEVRAQGPRHNRLSPAMAVHLINREEAMVIDVRDAAVYREGHIVNAKNIPLVDFDRQLEKLSRTRPVILVDAMGDKTMALVLRMQKAGFEKVFAIKGGMDGWKTASMPVVK